MSAAGGFPDWQRITQWFGNSLAQATGQLIGAGQVVVGPLNVRSFASIVVWIKPTGGQVTVTVTQQVPDGPASLVTQSSFVVNAGNVIAEAFVLLAGDAVVTFQGAIAGTTIDYAIVPANTNVNAEVAALTQLGFQHNDVVVATETAIDLEDAAPIGWTFLDDPANLRVKITPTLRQNGAVTHSVYRWTSTAWAPTSTVLIDDGNSIVYLAADTPWLRYAAGEAAVKASPAGLTVYDPRDAAGAGGWLRFRTNVGAPGAVVAAVQGQQVAAGSNVGRLDLYVNNGISAVNADRITATGAWLQIVAKAGAPTDADIPAGLNVPMGRLMVWDDTNLRLWIRDGAAVWRFAQFT